jgi:hypothetical protein
MRRFWRSRHEAAPPAEDYKTVWNRAAATNAVDAILTGATDETFERSGAEDAARLQPLVRPGVSRSISLRGSAKFMASTSAAR